MVILYFLTLLCVEATIISLAETNAFFPKLDSIGIRIQSALYKTSKPLKNEIPQDVYLTLHVRDRNNQDKDIVTIFFQNSESCEKLAFYDENLQPIREKWIANNVVRFSTYRLNRVFSPCVAKLLLYIPPGCEFRPTDLYRSHELEEFTKNIPDKVDLLVV